MLAIGPRRAGNKVAPAVAPKYDLGKACEGLLAIAMKTGVSSTITRQAGHEISLRLHTTRRNPNFDTN
jgi:hypothetical protein